MIDQNEMKGAYDFILKLLRPEWSEATKDPEGEHFGLVFQTWPLDCTEMSRCRGIEVYKIRRRVFLHKDFDPVAHGSKDYDLSSGDFSELVSTLQKQLRELSETVIVDKARVKERERMSPAEVSKAYEGLDLFCAVVEKQVRELRESMSNLRLPTNDKITAEWKFKIDNAIHSLKNLREQTLFLLGVFKEVSH